MLSIGANLASRTHVQTLIEPKKDAVPKDPLEAPAAAEAKPAEGVSVTISGAAMLAAKADKASNSDIDDSGLGDSVKQLLKMIRQIKQQIAEKQAELAAVMADKSLTPEQAKARMSGLQSALNGLQASLTTAQASLTKSMKNMSGGDAAKAANLAVK